MPMRHASFLALGLAALLAGCARGEPPPRDSVVGARPRPAIPDTADSLLAVPELPVARRAAIEQSARDVLSFLRNQESFVALALADTVELHLAREGAGTSTGVSVRLARGTLRDRDAWRIRAGDRWYSFVPPKGLTKTTARAGTHFNCREIPLASRVPVLAGRPHVGVLLEPPESTSCLETWNATFVFDTSTATPRLVAALYDQWEW